MKAKNVFFVIWILFFIQDAFAWVPREKHKVNIEYDISNSILVFVGYVKKVDNNERVFTIDKTLLGGKIAEACSFKIFGNSYFDETIHNDFFIEGQKYIIFFSYLWTGEDLQIEKMRNYRYVSIYKIVKNTSGDIVLKSIFSNDDTVLLEKRDFYRKLKLRKTAYLDEKVKLNTVKKVDLLNSSIEEKNEIRLKLIDNKKWLKTDSCEENECEYSGVAYSNDNNEITKLLVNYKCGNFNMEKSKLIFYRNGKTAMIDTDISIDNVYESNGKIRYKGPFKIKKKVYFSETGDAIYQVGSVLDENSGTRHSLDDFTDEFKFEYLDNKQIIIE